MIHKSWEKYLKEETQKDYFKNILSYINDRKKQNIEVYPSSDLIYKSLSCAPENIKVIIVGQDPYHNPGQANGLAFSVQKGVVLPPSLKNIYKEIQSQLNVQMPSHGDLSSWVDQGVLLLNTSLTVEKNAPASHSKIGWQTFTDHIIKTLSDNYKNNVFILWGNHAKAKLPLINQNDNLILSSAHPSPFSATKFFGNGHFIKTNEYLLKNNRTPIQWQKI